MREKERAGVGEFESKGERGTARGDSERGHGGEKALSIFPNPAPAKAGVLGWGFDHRVHATIACHRCVWWNRRRYIWCRANHSPGTQY